MANSNLEKAEHCFGVLDWILSRAKVELKEAHDWSADVNDKSAYLEALLELEKAQSIISGIWGKLYSKIAL